MALGVCLFAAGCASAPRGSPGVVAGEDVVVTVQTGVGYDSPEGVVVTEWLGPKHYSATAVAVLTADYPLKGIAIDDLGALRAFAVYDEPEGLDPNVEHRFGAVELDGRGRFVRGWPVESASQDCALVVTVDTSTDPPVTSYSCTTEDGAQPKTCQLKQRLLLGQMVFVGDCALVAP